MDKKAKLFIKKKPEYDLLGISDCHIRSIEGKYEKEGVIKASVLITDPMEGGLAGPYEINDADIEIRLEEPNNV